MTEKTAFQRIVGEEAAQEMIDDLEELDPLMPEETDPEDIQAWEIAISFTTEDIPHMIEELEEIANDEG